MCGYLILLVPWLMDCVWLVGLRWLRINSVDLVSYLLVGYSLILAVRRLVCSGYCWCWLLFAGVA